MTEMLLESRFERLPIAKFGVDHASTLAYVESVCTERQKFGIGHDPKMRVSRRHFRIFCEAFGEKPAAHVRRAFTEFGYLGMIMTIDHGTRLRDGSRLEGHDDWDCLEDLAAAGLLETSDPVRSEGLPTIRLTAKGQRMASAIRAHKQAGGGFANFRWTTKPQR